MNNVWLIVSVQQTLYSIIIIWVLDNIFFLFKQEKPNRNRLKQNIKYNKHKNKIKICRFTWLISLGNYQVQIKVASLEAQLTSSRIWVLISSLHFTLERESFPNSFMESYSPGTHWASISHLIAAAHTNQALRLLAWGQCNGANPTGTLLWSEIRGKMNPQNKTKMPLPERRNGAREAKIADNHSSLEELKLAWVQVSQVSWDSSWRNRKALKVTWRVSSS